MALWPFSKKNKDKEVIDAPTEEAASQAAPEPESQAQATPDAEPEAHAVTGPFDGDSTNIEDFDFSDYAAGILDLKSLRLPIPKGAQVQVEMGERGPRMIHIVTTVGRITPVAFAAPKSGGQWEEASEEIREGMSNQGLSVNFEEGPWGREILGTGNGDAVIRMIGVDGPRWMLRFTLAGPADRAEALAQVGRDLAARTFVYRGNDPILAGNSLPVVVPPQLAQQVQQEMARRQAQQNPTSPQDSQEASEALRKAQEQLNENGRNS